MLRNKGGFIHKGGLFIGNLLIYGIPGVDEPATGDIEQFTPPLSNYPGQNRVEIAGSLKLRAFWGADSPKPILKLFSVEIVISSRDDKSRNC